MELIDNWIEVKSLFRDAFRSSFHYAIATVDENGEPHVTPIGSLILAKPGHGFYFEKFAHQLPRNIGINGRVCVLAVNSDRWFWLKSLFRGRFSSPPAVRLYGVAGALRPANVREIELWQRRVGKVRFTLGHKLMWREMTMVRDIVFDRIEPVHIGTMTHGVWSSPAQAGHDDSA